MIRGPITTAPAGPFVTPTVAVGPAPFRWLTFTIFVFSRSWGLITTVSIPTCPSLLFFFKWAQSCNHFFWIMQIIAFPRCSVYLIMYAGLFIYSLIGPRPFQWVLQHQSTDVIRAYVIVTCDALHW